MSNERELLDFREEQEFSRITPGNDSKERFAVYRSNVWGPVDSILKRAQPYVDTGKGCTGLALGYVQSGKTTSIVGLMAAACDAGYRIIIGFIAVNDNLLDQNAKRILGKLGIAEDGRRVWYTSVQGALSADDDEIIKNLEQRNRTVLILVLKNTAQIRKVTSLLKRIDTSKYKVLVVDDEADQVSLNTLIRKGEESPTYKSLLSLRGLLKGHLYIQYTATPYANLLLTPDDTLAPDFLEILPPGIGYTGGKAFFIDQGDVTFRSIGNETLKSAPGKIPPNLERALANFLVGSSLMFCNEGEELAEKTSMLINVHQENAVQIVYKEIIERRLSGWKQSVDQASALSDLPQVIRDQYQDLLTTGVDEPEEGFFLRNLQQSFDEINIWLVNQTTKGRAIRWGEYKLHILIGANKLDRGFTIEGLTVTYMSRRESAQIDTMQQRSRAYGYRPFLKYCRIFTNEATRKILKDTVHTEEDLREQLVLWMESGRDFKEWASEIGLIISSNSKPTRDSVVRELITRNLGSWFYLLKSNTDDDTLDYNKDLIERLGIADAAFTRFGSQSHRHKILPREKASELIAKWRVDLAPSWISDSSLIKRTLLESALFDNVGGGSGSETEEGVNVLLISTFGAGEQRTRREWSPITGLEKGDLFQSRNADYPGDTNLIQSNRSVIQIHRIRINQRVHDAPLRPLYFLAIRLGSKWTNARRRP